MAEQLWGLLLNFDWFVHKVECPNVSTINCNLENGWFSVSSVGIRRILIGFEAILKNIFLSNEIKILAKKYEQFKGVKNL